MHHLVPKSVDAAPSALDSRGAFLVHAQSSTVFVWLGRACEPAMADSAAATARQVLRYEGARGPITTVREGAEPPGFWDALADPPSAAADTAEPGKRRVEMYDLDFEIFRRALRGGVLLPLPVPGSSTSETHLPARESGWSRVREKFSAKQLATEERGTLASIEEDPGGESSFRSPGSFSHESSTTPSSSLADSSSTMSTFSPASTSSLDWNKCSPPVLKQHIAPPLPLAPPHPSHLPSLPPLYSGKGKDTDSLSSSTAFRPLAERRGGLGPIILLPTADEGKCRLSPREIVRDWCLSPNFIPDMEENHAAMDTE